MSLSHLSGARLPNEQSIRILTLKSGGPDDPLEGSLDSVGIEDTGQYEALSYVWSSTARPRTLSCEGVDIGLTESLFQALLRIRLPDADRRIWADQICIDQDDLDDRSHQVQFMNAIYKKAKGILVWLGSDEKNEAPAAFDLVHGLANDMYDLDQDPKDYEERMVDFSPLRSLSRLQWFTRAWIVQEVGTNANATLLWGATEIDWQLLYAASEKLTKHDRFRRQLGMRTAEIKYIHRRFMEPDRTSRDANRFSFIYELHRARHLKVSDPRDRVFAFLGHYSVRNSSNTSLRLLHADYTKAVNEVYIDTAVRSLQDNPDPLITLAAVQHSQIPSKLRLFTRKASKVEHLPSWVPDWRTYQSHILSEPTSPHRTAVDTTATIIIEQDSRTLNIHGVVVDAITVCSRKILSRTFHNQNKTYTAQEIILQLWRRICQQPGPLSLEPRYNKEESLVFALMQTLSNGCAPIWWRDLANGKSNFQSYNDVTAEEWLAYGASSLASISNDPKFISQDILQLAIKAGKDASSWIRAADWASSNRCVARTSKGFFVLGPAIIEEGDVICTLSGGKLPFCLRPWNGQFLLVGECYVHGLVAGEVKNMLEANEAELGC